MDGSISRAWHWPKPGNIGMLRGHAFSASGNAVFSVFHVFRIAGDGVGIHIISGRT
jgi:hypothetical protein